MSIANFTTPKSTSHHAAVTHPCRLIAMKRPLCLTALLFAALLPTPPTQAQTPPSSTNLPSAAPAKPPIEWDAISIHQHDPNDTNMNWGFSPDGVNGRGVTLRSLISQAYNFSILDLRDDELIGLPAWAKNASYDFTAKVSPEDVPAWDKMENLSMEDSIQHMLNHQATDEMLMMRSLLLDRFGLKVHYETRIEPVYEVVLDKGGATLKPAKDSTHGNMTWNGDVIKGTGVPAPFLAMMLGMPLQRTVIDHTGLKGHFDFELHFLPNNAPPNPNSNDPDLFTAVREQLGLKLQPAKASVLVVVVDTIHELSPN